MYTPAHFGSDESHAVQVMREHGFALLVSVDANGSPFITHCPLVVLDDGKRLLGHLARANPHVQLLEHDARVLGVFNGPHAYVSPSWYASVQAVPTWNYLAVHVHGSASLQHDAEAKEAALKQLIAIHDPAYLAQWNELGADYRAKMLGGIVAFEIAVTRIEGKFKISQNRPAEDRQRVHAEHGASHDDARQLARWMQQLGLV
jgi:transcriptional regulator